MSGTVILEIFHPARRAPGEALLPVDDYVADLFAAVGAAFQAISGSGGNPSVFSTSSIEKVCAI